MSFDFGWFLTLPGMFITGGVILLIIALIILIITNKKAKKEKNPMDSNAATAPVVSQTAEVVSDPNAISMPQQGVVENPVQPGVAMDNNLGVNPSVQPEPMMGGVEPATQVVDPALVMAATANTDMAPAVPVVPAPTPSEFDAPVVAPAEVGVQQVDVQPMTPPPLDIKPIVEEPVQPVVAPEEVAPVMPNVVEQASVVTPEVTPTPVEVAPTVVPVTPVQPASTTIYGGVSPVVPPVEVNPNASHQIYGGADPLENTQSIPQVSPVTPTPVEVAPTVAPVTPVTPSVQPAVTPVVQPVQSGNNQ